VTPKRVVIFLFKEKYTEMVFWAKPSQHSVYLQVSSSIFITIKLTLWIEIEVRRHGRNNLVLRGINLRRGVKTRDRVQEE